MNPIAAAIAALGTGPLTEPALRAHVDPLFSRTLARPGLYLANHSLGRPLDRSLEDVARGAALWADQLDDAWGPWLEAQTAFRAGVAGLLGVDRPDCIVPKTSAGQGLRTVLGLGRGRGKLQVLTTRGEFDSLDVILRHHRDRGRLDVRFIEPDGDGLYDPAAILAELDETVDLLVLSHVMFMTGQVIGELPAIVAKARACGARVLLDVYHSFGVLPLDLPALGVDFAVGGGYKYLRGGPGSCWLYVCPEAADLRLHPLDTGWFAKASPFTYERPDPPAFAPGGDGFQESTPPVIVPYQALAGLEFTAGIGVERLRAYGQAMARDLVAALGEVGVKAEGGTDAMGAFVVVRHPEAGAVSKRLAAAGVATDARGDRLRLTPDVLTPPESLVLAAQAVQAAMVS